MNKFIGHNPLNVYNKLLPSRKLIMKLPKHYTITENGEYDGFILAIVPTSYFKRNANFVVNIATKNSSRKYLWKTSESMNKRNDIFKYPCRILNEHDIIKGRYYKIKSQNKSYLYLISLSKVIPVL